MGKNRKMDYDDPEWDRDAQAYDEGQPRQGDAQRDEHGGKRGGKQVDTQRDEHGECCEECKRTCKRNFWTEVLRTVTKVAGIILASLGLQSFYAED